MEKESHHDHCYDPGYVTGTWTIDPFHTEIGFLVRHLMVSKIRGRFEKFTGTITTAANPQESHAEAEIDLSSINTGNDQRDNHLRGSDFLRRRDQSEDDVSLDWHPPERPGLP